MSEQKNINFINSLKKNHNFLNWLLGNIICMLGISIATKSDFGLSMMSSGPYVLHVWLRDRFAGFTQGTAEYFYEALVLILMCIVIKEFKPKYLLSFAEAFFSGMILDGWFLLFGGNGPFESLGMRIAALFLGMIVTALGVAFFFRTELPLQTYDLAVVRISAVYNIPQKKVKLCFDYTMLAIATILSLLLTHKLTGIGIGTVITTACNAFIINFWGKLIDKLEKN